MIIVYDPRVPRQCYIENNKQYGIYLRHIYTGVYTKVEVGGYPSTLGLLQCTLHVLTVRCARGPRGAGRRPGSPFRLPRAPSPHATRENSLRAEAAGHQSGDGSGGQYHGRCVRRPGVRSSIPPDCVISSFFPSPQVSA